MLIQFFLNLKEAKVPVSVREFLTLLEALKSGVINPSIDEFYQLSRMTLMKDERHFDRFDQVFGEATLMGLKNHRTLTRHTARLA